jgi:diadenosine tetraphosphatase ApaH/serine/threonine PP2A family protein phosphatase
VARFTGHDDGTITVLTALFTDIHGNREAFEACLAHASRFPVERYVFLGDYVGYGADPGFIVDTVRGFVARGAIALLGNHDSAAIGTPERMNEEAALAIDWTRLQLTTEQIGFLRDRPLAAEQDGTLYVHASAAEPAHWDYIVDTSAAARCFLATSAERIFCGHTHVPALFHRSATAKLAGFEPAPGVAMPLTAQRRWVAVIGSVGQPRDRNPAACYALYDDVARELTYQRLPYDVETAQRKIREAGLPLFLSARLAWGR